MFKRIKKSENEINDLKKEIKESKEKIQYLKEKIQDLKEKLYENLDNQKINELSKKYKAKMGSSSVRILRPKCRAP